MITHASCFHATRNFRARSRVLCANQPLVDFGGGFIRRTKKKCFLCQRDFEYYISHTMIQELHDV